MNKKAGKWRCTLSLYRERSYKAANGTVEGVSVGK